MKIMSSRLDLPVSGPAYKDRNTHTAVAGTFSCTVCTSTAYLAKMGKGREHRRQAHRAEACNARAGKRFGSCVQIFIHGVPDPPFFLLHGF